MPRTLSQKSSFQLFLWGIILIPFAVISDAVLDAVIFGFQNIQEQLLTPTYHEVSSRMLFSTFILAGVYLGMHFLAKTSQKEAALQRYAQDLTLIRQDLEDFHEELSGRLRHTSMELANAVKLLQTQCSDDFDEKTGFFMKKIYDTSAKLNEQLEINLALAAFAFGEPNRKHTKLDLIANEVANEMKIKHPGRKIEFNIQPWLTDWCDPKMARLVLTNLFSSAMDFIPPEREGCIDFGMFHRKLQKVFYVRDNGTSYSENKAKHLFDAFQDNAQETGQHRDSVKLACARRLVNRHGGKIWAEGIEGSGGTVFFTCNAPE